MRWRPEGLVSWGEVGHQGLPFGSQVFIFVATFLKHFATNYHPPDHHHCAFINREVKTAPRTGLDSRSFLTHASTVARIPARKRLHGDPEPRMWTPGPVRRVPALSSIFKECCRASAGIPLVMPMT